LAYGPATFFSSNRVDVSTQGTTGAGGTVTSSVNIAGVDTSLSEIVTADAISSTCTASANGLSGTTTLTNAKERIDSGDDVVGDIHPEVKVSLPTNPPISSPSAVQSPAPPPQNLSLPNPGHIHVNNSIDYFHIVFNEQVINPDGSLTVNAVHEYLDGPSAIGHVILGQSTCGRPNGGVTVIGVACGYRSDLRFLAPSATTEGCAPQTSQYATYSARVADFDGNGRSDISVFRPSSGMWFVNGILTTGFGVSTDIPVPGDYNGDGRVDIGVFRPSTGFWYVNYTGGGGIAANWGATGDTPVPADYNGDGKTDLAVFRPSTGIWYVSLSGGTNIVVTSWGASGDIPVPGDYNNDGNADIAVFRPSTGIWYVSPGGGGAVTSWGASGDIPVPADYNLDGKTDIAVFRPSTGIWYVSPAGGGTITSWGGSGDRPLPLPAAIRQVFFP